MRLATLAWWWSQIAAPTDRASQMNWGPETSPEHTLLFYTLYFSPRCPVSLNWQFYSVFQNSDSAKTQSLHISTFTVVPGTAGTGFPSMQQNSFYFKALFHFKHLIHTIFQTPHSSKHCKVPTTHLHHKSLSQSGAFEHGRCQFKWRCHECMSFPK